MADQSNIIDISLQDKVDAQISVKIIQIADAADRGEKAVGSLKAQLASIASSGLGTLLSQLQNVQSASVAIANSQDTLAAKTRAASTSSAAAASELTRQTAATAAQAAATSTLAGVQNIEAAAYRQVAEATLVANAAKATLSQLSRELTASTVGEQDAVTLLAAAMLNQIEASQQLELAKANLAEVSAFLVEQSEQSALVLQAEAAATREKQMADIQLAATGTMQSRIEADLSNLRTQDVIALDRQTVSSERLAVTQEELNTIMEQALGSAARYTAVTEAEAAAQNTAAAATRGAATAAAGQVSANVSAAASIGLMEGRTLSMNRAAANFATRILGLGPLLQAAFPIIGAIAMLAVLYQIGEALYKTVVAALNAGTQIAKAFDSAIGSLRKADDQLAVTNDKLDATINKLQHKPTTNGAALAIDEAREAADRLDSSLERVQNDLDTVLKKNQIGFMGTLLTGQAGTGGTANYIQKQFDQLGDVRQKATEALDKASATKDPKAAAEATKQAYEDERKSIQGVVTSLQTQYNLTKQIQDAPPVQSFGPRGQMISIKSDQTANLTLLGKSAHLAQEELRSLDLTMANIAKNKVADKLRDDSSAMRSEAKAATEQWKELESAYKHFQETQAAMGHKTTPKENLDALQSLSKTLTIPSQQNQDRLTALKLPQQDKLDETSFKSNETAKLQDQISEIGLYSDSLKEAAMLNHILEQARQKNIDLSPSEVAGYQKQIATIVTARQYDRELADVYGELTGAQVKFNAEMSAVNTLLSRGQISADQHNQAILNLMKGYNEATSAVTAFQDKLKQQGSDAGNKLGTDRQIAVKQDLQGLDEQLRKPGADAQHPFGYSAADIQKVNAALTPLIAAQKDKNAVDEEANKLINAQANLEDKLTVQELALAKAVQAGAMSQQAANSARLKGQLDLNSQQLNSGTGGNPITGALGDYAKQFTTVAAGIQSAFAPVFKTLADGFADSIGKAIVYSKDLGKALKDVARSAIAELISALIKLAIQYAIVNVLQKVLHIKPLPTPTVSATQAATTVGAMAAITTAGLIMTKLLDGPMWSLAGAMAGVTFGASAAAGTAGIAALGTAEKTASGGVPSLAVGTNALPADMYIFAHQDERVVPAADNRAIISALNAPQQRGSSAPRVEVHNHNGSRIQVQHMDEGTVRLIVRDEAPQLIAQHAPNVIAADIGDPNSKTSKSIRRNVTPSRVR